MHAFLILLKFYFVEVSLQIFKKKGGGFRTLLFVWDRSEKKKVFNNENNDLNLLAVYYFPFMLHL